MQQNHLMGLLTLEHDHTRDIMSFLRPRFQDPDHKTKNQQSQDIISGLKVLRDPRPEDNNSVLQNATLQVSHQ